MASRDPSLHLLAIYWSAMRCGVRVVALEAVFWLLSPKTIIKTSNMGESLGEKWISPDRKSEPKGGVSVELNFEIGNTPAKFIRSSFTGSARLVVGGTELMLQSPWNPFTYVSLRAYRSWKREIAGHTVTVERLREYIFLGTGPCKYRAIVDGKIVSEATGM
jgi:hypothetical protein